MKLAATIMQVLPNGKQHGDPVEVRVNFEKRILEFAGVIRPQDITIDNTISYDKVAEARVSYGGKPDYGCPVQPVTDNKFTTSCSAGQKVPDSG